VWHSSLFWWKRKFRTQWNFSKFNWVLVKFHTKTWFFTPKFTFSLPKILVCHGVNRCAPKCQIHISCHSTVAEQYQRCFRPNELVFRPNNWLPVSVSDLYSYVGNLLLILPMCARPFLHLTWRYFSKRKGCAWTRYLEFKSQLFLPLYEGELGTWVYQ